MQMSLHELMMIVFVFVLFWNIFWKWQKTFLVIVFMELITTMIIAGFFSFLGSGTFIVVIFVFFVSEALVLISSLYSSMRIMGVVYGSLVLI